MRTSRFGRCRVPYVLGGFALVAIAFALALVAPMRAHASFGDFANGTYELSGISCDTGMIVLDKDDRPGRVVVRDDGAWLVAPLYCANKYDALWKGRRSAAPADPANASDLVGGAFVEMDDAYASTGGQRGNRFTDDTTGTTYKAVEFAIPLTAAELGAGRVDIVVRRAAWGPSNPGQWMGSSDHYLTFTPPSASAAPSSASTELPEVTHLDRERARRLIGALPADSFDIEESAADQVAAAALGYDLLSDADQAQLDSDVCASSQSYGRILEAARWRIASFADVDNSTSLADGTYTGKASVSADMGKSTSARARTWTADKLVVSGGKAIATITWTGSTALGSLQLGGKSYENVGTDGLSSFDIPVDLNSDMYFAVKTRDAAEQTAALAYHFLASIDEAKAKPDGAEADSGSDSGKGSETGSEAGSGTGSEAGSETGSEAGSGASSGTSSGKGSGKSSGKGSGTSSGTSSGSASGSKTSSGSGWSASATSSASQTSTAGQGGSSVVPKTASAVAEAAGSGSAAQDGSNEGRVNAQVASSDGGAAEGAAEDDALSEGDAGLPEAIATAVVLCLMALGGGAFFALKTMRAEGVWK